MYNPRESLKTATSIGIAGLGVATLGFGGLGALLLGGAALGAGATGINSLIDPERPYKVEKRERKESAPLTPEDKKRYDERADKIVDGIETFLGGAKSLGKYSLKYSAKAVISPFKYSFKGVRAAKKLVDKVVKEKREKKRQEG
ncbi:MAG: hypothetical protein KJ905_02780 [Nanoarchaeota archaeon]|nr:hypothetical protein [Nanoarchaeota archaeon]MBU1501674.1 hypothetical protein [Nanoarchaeota archaeon]